MRYSFLLFLLAVFFPSASFAKWVEIGYNSDLKVTVYLDDVMPKKIQKKLQTKILYNFLSSSYEGNIKHKSEIETVGIYCNSKGFTLDNVVWLSDSMGLGGIVWETKNNALQAIEAKTVYEAVYIKVCNLK
jgi:hypothetical protein